MVGVLVIIVLVLGIVGCVIWHTNDWFNYTPVFVGFFLFIVLLVYTLIFIDYRMKYDTLQMKAQALNKEFDLGYTPLKVYLEDPSVYRLRQYKEILED